MQPIETISGPVSHLDRANVDTDQIMPKQFLKRVERTGFGEFLFYDWAKEPGWDLPPNPILVAGENFGCGSSREHAPWALLDYGFRAVISSSIADIFRANALKNGLLPVIVDPAAHKALLAGFGQRVAIDLASRTLSYGSTSVSFPIDPFARECLLRGVDELGYLLSLEEEISRYEREAGCAR